MKNPKQQVGATSQKIRNKWGDVLIDAGYTITPSILIEHFVRVTGRDSTDLHIIEFLNMHWWDADNKPRPSKEAIARAVGIHPNTVRRRIKKMEEDNLITRSARYTPGRKNNPNHYLLEPLISIFEKVARHKIEDRRINKELKKRRAEQRSYTSKVRLKIVS